MSSPSEHTSTSASSHSACRSFDRDSPPHIIRRGGSFRGRGRGDYRHPRNTEQSPPEAGDLSNFANISSPNGLSFGPTSVINKRDSVQRGASRSRASASRNMFALSGGRGRGDQFQSSVHTSPNSYRQSGRFDSGGSPTEERGSLRQGMGQLSVTSLIGIVSTDDGADTLGLTATLDALKLASGADERRIYEDIKRYLYEQEYLYVESVEEAILALEKLPSDHRHVFVDKLIRTAFIGGNKTVVLAEKLFASIAKQGAWSTQVFERGLLPSIETADDTAIDVPHLYEWLARMIHAAGLERSRVEDIAGNISVIPNEARVSPKDKLLQEFDRIRPNSPDSYFSQERLQLPRLDNGIGYRPYSGENVRSWRSASNNPIRGDGTLPDNPSLSNPHGSVNSPVERGNFPIENTVSQDGAARRSLWRAKIKESKGGLGPLFTAGEPGNPLDRTADLSKHSDVFASQPTPTPSETLLLVERDVVSLLNKLTVSNFDSVLDQIIERVNNNEDEKNGSTLMRVVELIIGRAKGEKEGQSITGGLLFRQYLVTRCQEDFERGSLTKDTVAILAAGRTRRNKVTQSDQYHAAVKSKRQVLGLIRFIGQLFKFQLISDRIMHECIKFKRLFADMENPEEDEIESLCMLLTTVGQQLDTPKVENYMDIYFNRIAEMSKSRSLSPAMQSMLQDVLQLRQHRWRHHLVSPPSPGAIASYSPGRYNSRGHRGGIYSPPINRSNFANSYNVARPTPTFGNFSNFGRGFNSSGRSYAGTGTSRWSGSSAQSVSSISMSSSGNSSSTLATSDDNSSLWSEGGSRRLNLFSLARSNDQPEEQSVSILSVIPEGDAQKIKENIMVYSYTRNVEEAVASFKGLSVDHRCVFIDKIIGTTLDKGPSFLVFAERLFAAIHEQEICSVEVFERGMLPTVEMADDISIFVPKLYTWLARLMHAAGIDRSKIEEMAERISVYGEPELRPKELLLGEYENMLSGIVHAPVEDEPSGFQHPNPPFVNQRKQHIIQSRQESPIIGLRYFNNWAKSVLFIKFSRRRLRCNKGGDLRKWCKIGIKEYVGLDNVEANVAEARRRHMEIRIAERFNAEFHTINYFSDSISSVVSSQRLSTPFDIVSMQFRMQYAFECEDKVRTTLKNISSYLRTGGIFVGTMPNSDKLLPKLDQLEPGELSFGNSVYRVRFDHKERQSIYGHKYWFNMFSTIEDLPEYIVPWEDFQSIALEYGLKSIYRSEFRDLFNKERRDPEYGPLLKTMKVVNARGDSELTEDQWDAANVYIAFAFEKV
ncbi:mRNA cap guanine-N7 methyltransferase [Ceratobasidium sp. AG-Ba]|nr:mRNA cap guanine-N7 methyltransferase [Ceratobasidium sp. AG-Ba]